jgi:predicted sulfurtransferase
MAEGRFRRGFSILVAAGFVFFAAASVMEAGVPRISPEELKGMLGDPDVIVIDVRRGMEWDDSDFKIKGAARETGFVSKWAGKYPKDKTIVLYCA